MGIMLANLRRVHCHKVFGSLALLFASVFLSTIAAEEVQTNKALKQYISTSTNQLVTKLAENRQAYKADSELFYRDLNTELSNVIDFKRIALKVMGKYSRQASKAQRLKFINKFKESLYHTYANVLLEDNAVEISVINAILNPRNLKKAKANIAITSAGGAIYDVVYSLHKGKDQIYRVENIVVMGINLGLAYKDRFQQQVKAHKGDIKMVIDNWTFDGAV